MFGDVVQSVLRMCFLNDVCFLILIESHTNQMEGFD